MPETGERLHGASCLHSGGTCACSSQGSPTSSGCHAVCSYMHRRGLIRAGFGMQGAQGPITERSRCKTV